MGINLFGNFCYIFLLLIPGIILCLRSEGKVIRQIIIMLITGLVMIAATYIFIALEK